MTRYGRGLMVALAASAVVAGCGSSSNDTSSDSPTAAAATTTTQKGKPVHAAWLAFAVTDYQQGEEVGIKRVLEPDGGTATQFVANFDAQKQLQQCQDAITSGRYNAILLSTVTPPTGVPCVNAARAAGIPVVTIETQTGTSTEDINPQVPGVVGVVTAPNSANNEAVVKMATEACRGLDPCKIIGEVASPQDPITNDQLKAVAKDVPNAEVVQKISGQYDPAIIAKAFPDAMAAHPDAKVFLAAADSQALAVVPIVKQAGREDIRIIGNGGSRLGVQAIKDGDMYGTVGNWPEQMGAAAAKMMSQAVNGEPVEPKGVNVLELDEPLIVTKENVDQFKPEWGAQRAG